MGQLVRLSTRAEPLLTKTELADHLRYSERWIEMQMRDRGMPYMKGDGRGARVRFRLSEVEAWMMRRSA